MHLPARGFAFQCALALFWGLTVNPAEAQPAGGQVVAGTATISTGAGALTVTQTSARAIIHWQDFSLAAGGLARFIQPDATSATLNRVISGLPSSLDGTLLANGRVYLINPNGILVGAQARIDTAGFLASTLDVANQEFLAGGDLHFTGGSTAAIKNLGAINALGGDVFLIARAVENAGAVTAANGTAGLAAGSEILLTTGGNERLFVLAASVPGAIVNSGTMTAATAELKAAGGNAFALAINNSGLVRATGTALRDGRVWLVASGAGAAVSSGTLAAGSADGVLGGEVRVLGDQVTLAAGALVDVSGAQRGGTALIGGDYQGGNQAVPNARTTVVEEGATIRADATVAGDGGKVIVWADGSTFFGGAISARGGEAGGDGGLAEVSGKAFLAYRGLADLLAPLGATGALLLDPTDITITGAGTDAAPTSGSFAGGTFDGDANSTSTISIGTGAGDTNSTLLKQLATANIVVATASAGTGTGNIIVNGPISYNSTNSLTLSAGNDLTINNPITNAGEGGLVLGSGATTAVNAALSTAGTLSLSANSGVTLAANVTTNGLTTVNADADNNGTGTLTVANNITLATTNSPLNITAADIAVVFFGALNSGTAATSITASANRSIGLGGTAADLTLTNTELSHLTASSLTLRTTGLTGDMTVNGINFAGSINAGPVTLNAGGTVTFATNASTFFKGLTVRANDGLAVGADLTASNGNIVLDGDADNVASTGDGITFTGSRILTALTDYSVIHDTTQGSIILGNGTAGANGNIASAALELRAFNGVTIADDLTATGGNFTAVVNPDGQYVMSTGIFTVASGKTVATATSGSIDLTASDIALDGSLASVGTASITASYNIFAGLGSFVEPGGLNLSDAEFGRITATGLTIGVDVRGLNTTTAAGLTAANTDQFGALTLTTTGTIHFQDTSVVGNRLSANADGGIVFIALANLSTSTAGTADPDLTLSGNNIFFNNTVTVAAGGTGTLGLTTTGALTSHGDLTLESGDNLDLNYALFAPGFLTLNADRNNDGTGTFTVAHGVSVGTTGAAHPLSLTAADVVLTGTGALNTGVSATAITASAGRSIGLGATPAAGGLNLAGSELQQITATNLTLTSAGTITVDGITEPNSNNITGTTTLTGNGGASTVTFATTASTFNALTVNSTTTIANNATLTLDVGNLVLNAGTDITQTGAIEIGSGTATLTGAAITLAHTANTLGAVTVNSGAGDVSLREDEGISVAGITRTGGSLLLQAESDITQTGPISIGTGAANFYLFGTNLLAPNVVLNGANVLGPVTVSYSVLAGSVSLTEADAIAFGMQGSAGVAALSLTAGGAITDNGGLLVSGATTLAAGATNDITLDDGQNDFNTIAVSSGRNVTLHDRTTLALGSVTAAGSLLVQAESHLTLNSGAAISATGAGADPLVLVTLGNFINNAGATALNAGSGRWLVYSTSPAGSTESGLTAAAGSAQPRLYNRTYANDAPATITAGNHLIYSSQPELIVIAAAATRLYGDANPAFTATIGSYVDGDGDTQGAFVADDGVTDTLATAGLTGTPELASDATPDSPVADGPFTISAAQGTLVSSAGYAFGNANALLTITARPVTVTADSGLTKVYGGGDPVSFTFTTTSLGGGGPLNGALTRTAGETVAGGAYSITQGTVTDTNNPNYLLTYNGSTFAITPATLTYTANAASRTVGASDPAFSGTINGFVGGEVQGTATTGTMGFATTATGASAAGLYPINGAGLTANNGNYVFVQAPPNATAFTISTLPPATPLTITADDKSKLYGAALPGFTASFAGFVNGDTPAVVTGLQFSTTATLGSNVGTFAITPFGATAPAAYLVGYVPGTLTINPAALSIRADDKSRTFAAANPAFTASFAGFVNGDTPAVVTGLQLTTGATVSSPVGSYAITAAGATAANYVLTYLPGTLLVGRNLLTITADPKVKTYGAALPAFTASFAGFVNGDTPAVVTGLQFSTTATTGSNTGTYAITPFGASAANYSLVYISGVLTISPAALILTATDAERDFGAPNPAFTGTFSGFVNGDTAAVVSGSTFSTPASPASTTGDYAITPRGATAANYTLAFVGGTLRVNTPSVIVGPTPQPVVTVGQIPALTPEFAVVELGDRLVLVPVGSPGDPAAPVDERLSITLGEATGLAGFESATTLPSGATSANTANLGRFELAASPGGSSPAPSPEPGLFRESTVNMGGFNIIYHEALAAAREQSASNTALGSSYREFSDSDNPQTNIVRAKQERKPAAPAAGPNPAGAP